MWCQLQASLIIALGVSLSVIFKRSYICMNNLRCPILALKVSSMRRHTRDIWETLKGQTWGRRFNQLFSATHYQPCLQQRCHVIQCFFLIFRLCNCIVCVLVFPGDSIAGRVVEGERGTLGSRSQRHAGWWSKKAPKLSFPSDYTPYILFIIIINTAIDHHI